MPFDVRAWLATHYAPWSVTLAATSGRPRAWTYAAREVSVVEVAAFRDQYAAATTPTAQVRALKRFLRRLFPQLFWWRRPDPVELILTLPDGAREALLTDFFAHRASRDPRRPTPSSLPASPSSGPPSAPAATASR